MKAYIKPETIAYDLLFGKDIADEFIGTSSGTNDFESRRQDFSNDSYDWSSDDFWVDDTFAE